MRAQIEKKMEQREKEKREDTLKQLAAKAREERAGIKRVDGKICYKTLYSRLASGHLD